MVSDTTQHDGLYKPLSREGEIRLLYLESVEECDSGEYKIWCSIRHKQLPERTREGRESDERTGYEALSYEWGSSEDPQYIWIRGHPTPIPVRANLYLALLHLLLPDEERPLWVDAICINQNDPGERNSQVTQMGRIYSRAERVVVWLGIASLDSSRAMGFLAQIEEAPESSTSEESFRRTFGFDRKISKTIFKSLMAVRSLCLRGYWGRLWITQELALGKEVVLHCGQDLVHWKKFAVMGKALENAFATGIASAWGWPIQLSSALRDIGESRAVQLISLREQTQGRDPLISIARRIFRFQDHQHYVNHDILEVFEQNSTAECQYSHDMVFGLLSITWDCCQNWVPVDYGIPVSQICYSVLEHHAVLHHSFTDDDLLLRRSQRLHQRLGASPSTFLASPLYPSKAFQKQNLRIKCTSRGCIRYLSQRSDDPTQDFESPSGLGCQSQRWLDLEVNQERDLVCPIPQAFSRSEGNGLHQCPNGLMDRQRNEEFLQEKDIQYSLAQLLDRAKGEDPETTTSSYKVAVDEQGAIFFVPLETQLGDNICRFEIEAQLGILAVVREATDGYSFVAGRAIAFFTGSKFSGESMSENAGKFFMGGMSSLDNAQKAPVHENFYMDTFAIQVLTRPSAFGKV
jgi:hypothetical protein